MEQSQTLVKTQTETAVEEYGKDFISDLMFIIKLNKESQLWRFRPQFRELLLEHKLINNRTKNVVVEIDVENTRYYSTIVNGRLFHSKHEEPRRIYRIRLSNSSRNIVRAVLHECELESLL